MRNDKQMTIMIIVAMASFLFLFVNGYVQCVEAIDMYQRVSDKGGYEKEYDVYSHNSEWDVSNEYIEPTDNGGYHIFSTVGDETDMAMLKRKELCIEDARELLASDVFEGKSVSYMTYLELGNAEDVYEMNFVVSYTDELEFDVETGYVISQDEFYAGSKGCLIGVGIEALTYTKDGKAYIETAGMEYEVTGILRSNKVGGDDYRIVIFDNELADNETVIEDIGERLFEGFYCMFIEYSYNNHTEAYADYGDMFFTERSSEDSRVDVTGGSLAYAARFVLTTFMLVFSVIIIFLISWLYIRKNKRSMAVMKAFGMKGIDIYRSLIKSILPIAMYGVMIGLLMELVYTGIFDDAESLGDVGAIAFCFGLVIIVALMGAVSLFAMRIIKKAGVVNCLREL